MNTMNGNFQSKLTLKIAASASEFFENASTSLLFVYWE